MTTGSWPASVNAEATCRASRTSSSTTRMRMCSCEMVRLDRSAVDYPSGGNRESIPDSTGGRDCREQRKVTRLLLQRSEKHVGPPGVERRDKFATDQEFLEILTFLKSFVIQKPTPEVGGNIQCR